MGGIYNKSVASASAVAVSIDSTGKLGTIKSSARYKEHIKPMEKASEALLKLEPVTFRYKQDLDPDGVTRFGLIAEPSPTVSPEATAATSPEESGTSTSPSPSATP